MATKRHVTRNPRVRLYPGGKATLAGLDYQDLRSILTAASLYTYAELKKAETKADTEERAERLRYYQQQRQLLDMAKDSISEAIAATFPKRGAPTIAERRAAVEESRLVRRLIVEMLSG